MSRNVMKILCFSVQNFKTQKYYKKCARDEMSRNVTKNVTKCHENITFWCVKYQGQKYV